MPKDEFTKVTSSDSSRKSINICPLCVFGWIFIATGIFACIKGNLLVGLPLVSIGVILGILVVIAKKYSDKPE